MSERLLAIMVGGMLLSLFAPALDPAFRPLLLVRSHLGQPEGRVDKEPHYDQDQTCEESEATSGMFLVMWAGGFLWALALPHLQGPRR